jgi:acylphosphatase
MMSAVDVVVSGRVQMVGFRAFTRRNAIMLGVKGYVENMEDGKVHAVIEGEGHQVEKLLEMVRQGPRSSEVRDVQVKDIDSHGYSGFEVR